MSKKKEFIDRVNKIRRALFSMKVIPDGAEKPLPGLPLEVEIDPQDDGEVQLWDRLMPKYRGMLNAKVKNKKRFK